MKSLLRIAGILAGAILFLGLLLCVYVFAVWDRPDPRSVPALSAPRDPATVARGKYLFTVTWQCIGCHQSPTEPGGALPSGGRVFDLTSIGPGFGVY
jgi:mono/diheme cytochrome c family protein